MQHRIDALMKFIASELCENETDAVVLLDDYNVNKVAKKEQTTPHELEKSIYKTFTDFGYEHARGAFDVMFND